MLCKELLAVLVHFPPGFPQEDEAIMTLFETYDQAEHHTSNYKLQLLCYYYDAVHRRAQNMSGIGKVENEFQITS